MELWQNYRLPNETFNCDWCNVDDEIKQMQEKLDIDYIVSLAKKYDVNILENNFMFLNHLERFNHKDEYLEKELARLELDASRKSDERLKIIKIAKMYRDNSITIKAKNNENLKTNNADFLRGQAESAINYAFNENRMFYCSSCKWDFETKDRVSIDEINLLYDVEKEYNSTRKSFFNPDNKRKAIITQEALNIANFAQLLFGVECFLNMLQEGYDFQFNNKWAYTSKRSCFIVDVLIHLNAISADSCNNYSNSGCSNDDKVKYVRSRLTTAKTAWY